MCSFFLHVKTYCSKCAICIACSALYRIHTTCRCVCMCWYRTHISDLSVYVHTHIEIAIIYDGQTCSPKFGWSEVLFKSSKIHSICGSIWAFWGKLAASILQKWPASASEFVRVFPKDHWEPQGKHMIPLRILICFFCLEYVLSVWNKTYFWASLAVWVSFCICWRLDQHFC